MALKKEKNIIETKENKIQSSKEGSNELNKNQKVNAENINLILDKHFMKLELIKFNLFGEDFENYGNIVLNGQTYYPYKLNLDYLANQSNDIAERDSNVNLDILKSLQKAEKIENNKEYMQKNRSIKETHKKFLNTHYKKMFKNKSCENINSKNIKLPKIKNKINVTRTNIKYFLERNYFEPKTIENKNNFIMKKKIFLDRYRNAQILTNKLNNLESNIKNIEKGIINDYKINEVKIPQFKYRYKYLESKFN